MERMRGLAWWTQTAVCANYIHFILLFSNRNSAFLQISTSALNTTQEQDNPILTSRGRSREQKMFYIKSRIVNILEFAAT
jgi:hypothetical protein